MGDVKANTGEGLVGDESSQRKLVLEVTGTSEVSYPNLDAQPTATEWDARITRNVEEALSGDWRTARDLLKEFAKTGASSRPVLISYIAERVQEWLSTDCAKEKARIAFRTAPPSHREASSDIKERHALAISRYLLGRGQGLDRQNALRAAAEAVHLDIKTIEPLLKGLHSRNDPFTPVQRRAIALIEFQIALNALSQKKALPGDFLRRCLRDGWDKWVAQSKKGRDDLISRARR